MKKVIIYTTPSCVFCKMTKKFFNVHKIEYEEKDVLSDLKAREEMFKKSGQMGVPVIDVEGEIVIGYDPDTLSKLLDIKK
jgi:glutaredoxin-like YruB-family protein